MEKDISNIDEIQKVFDDWLDLFMEELTKRMVTEMKNNLRVQGHIKTGNLIDSISYKKIGKHDYQIHIEAEYAAYIEFGTKDHSIFPKYKKALSWIQEGQRRFSKGHKVKGIKASPFVEPAINLTLNKAKNKEL